MAHKGLRGRAKPRKSSTVVNKKRKEKKGHISKRDFNRAIKAGRVPKPSAPVAPRAAKKVAAPAPGAEEAPRRTRKEARAAAALERQHQSLYEGQRVLLVGEGNFSFARALCRVLGTGSNVIATCLDDEATLQKKYEDAGDARKEIEESLGGTTLVGVDATRLHKVKEFRRGFGRIVWNFPHLGGGESDVERSVVQHQKLLADFFGSAAKCLLDDSRAQIHVALKEGEPYKSWKIVQVVRAACPDLDLLTVVPFATAAWEGYAHRRTQGFEGGISRDDSQELAKGAKVYVFGRRKTQS